MKYSSFIIRWRATLLVFLTHRLALPALRIIRRPDYFPFTATELATMPADTVGYALAHFLRTRQLELLPYYAKHDVKHVLLNYDATDEGEVCLQCFMLGNGHLSSRWRPPYAMDGLPCRSTGPLSAGLLNAAGRPGPSVTGNGMSWYMSRFTP